MSEIRVKGLSELQKFLDQLPAKLEANVMRGALRAGAKVIQKEAKSNVQNISGKLEKSIKVSSGRRGRRVTARIKTNLFYAKFVEYGTKPHLISVQDSEKNINLRRSAKFGKVMLESMTTINRRVLKIGNTFVGPTVSHPGATSTNPFMRPALDTRAQEAVVATAEYIKKRLATKEGLNTADIEIEGEL